MAFVLNSPAFADGDAIPKKHAQDGDNLSPPLEWRDPPPGTRSFVLMVEDADAPRNLARHWAVSDIPADCGRLAEGAGNAAKATLRHAVNDFGNLRYDGPAPLEGRKRHTYRFLLAALDVEHLDLPQSFAAAESFQGPLDGGWTLAEDRAGDRFAFQIVDRRDRLEAAWRDLRAKDALTTSGLVDDIQRSGGALTLRFMDGRGAPVSLTLKQASDDRWRGELTRGEDHQPVTLRRTSP